MPKIRINMDITQKGVIFDRARTQAEAKRMVIDINESIAQEGKRRVLAYLENVLVNPTGFYQSRIDVLRRPVYRGIWDQRVVYGGWLEGIDSRNRTSRFKGYFTFRRVKSTLDADKIRFAQPHVDEFVARMNRG